MKTLIFRATSFTSNLGTQRKTGNINVAVVPSVIIEKHSCWICQEKMSSEARLLQHYKNHLTYVCEDDFLSLKTLSVLLRVSSFDFVQCLETIFEVYKWLWRIFVGGKRPSL